MNMNKDMNNRENLDEINNGNQEPEMALDDEQRIRVLSPGMRFSKDLLEISWL